MFKNATIFRFSKGSTHTVVELPQFVPCGPTQPKSVGFVPPRGEEGGPMLENVGGQLIVKLMIETKTVPAHAIQEALKVAVANVERERGRKPGKKETRQIKEDLHQEMLTKAFPKRVAVTGWFNINDGLLIVDSASSARIDDFCAALVASIEKLELRRITSSISPTSLMSSWLFDHEATWDFALGTACQLQSTDETKARVRYANHNLANEEIREHIRTGKNATHLNLSWKDRISFTLTESGALTGIELLDDVITEGRDDQNAFDADVAIFTGEMKGLIKDLFGALDIERVPA